MRYPTLVCLSALLTACAVDTTPDPTAFSPTLAPNIDALGLDPNDAFGPITGSVPGGAHIISAEAAKVRLAQGRPDFVSAKRTQAVELARAAQMKTDEQTLTDFETSHPELASFMDADVTYDASTRLRSDGDVDFDAARVDGTSSTVITMGRQNRRHLLAQAIRVGAVRANRENVYKSVFAALPAVAGVGLPSPTSIAALDDAALDNAIDQLGRVASAEVAATKPSVLLPSQYEDCGPEQSALPLEETQPTKFTHSDKGLYAQISWPLKDKVTCVRDQGNRGTCAGFAAAAALEMYTSVHSGVKYDISEQDLYASYKRAVGEWQNDGAWPDQLTIQESMAGYAAPLEGSWMYNPSWSLTSTPQQPFLGACKGYAGACSETSHQTPMECVGSSGSYFCFWTPVSVVPVVPMVSSDQIRLHAQLVTNMSARTTAVNLAAALLAFTDQQIIVAFDIMSSFDAAGADGYVSAKLGGSQRGAHAMQLVGWIPNSQLPSSVSPASGGGYFVAKNSWGRNRGDEGYYYVPFNWLATYILDVVAL